MLGSEPACIHYSGVIILTFTAIECHISSIFCNCAAQISVTGQRLMVKHWKTGRYMKDCPMILFANTLISFLVFAKITVLIRKPGLCNLI